MALLTLNRHDVHIWYADLNLTSEQAAKQLSVLSADEQARALRFRFPVHQQRFIAARYALRHILNLYIGVAAPNISFIYTEHKKSYLPESFSAIQFNLAHSAGKALYAITQEAAVGIDVEQVRDNYDAGIVERFFSQQEQMALRQLSDTERNMAFYRLWARKEAVLKATGKGLHIPLNQFAVAPTPCIETIMLENTSWQLLPLAVDEGYQAALAVEDSVNKLVYRYFR